MPSLMPDAGPQRTIAASNFVYTVGSGLFLTAGVLSFTQAVHLPACQVGLGLGIAGFVSLSAGMPTWAGVTLLMTAVLIHTVGELWHAAGGFEVSFALAPEHATGQYLGVFGLGAGLADALGPTLLISLCITWGRPGWYVVGALFALTGLATPFAVRWAQRHQQARQPHPATALKESAV